jgi:hypothetical protein
VLDTFAALTRKKFAKLEMLKLTPEVLGSVARIRCWAS